MSIWTGKKVSSGPAVPLCPGNSGTVRMGRPLRVDIENESKLSIRIVVEQPLLMENMSANIRVCICNKKGGSLFLIIIIKKRGVT